MADGIEEIRKRLDVLEAQHAITVDFTRFLLMALLSEQPESERSALQASLERTFEHTIAGLLASEHAFPDISIQAVEVMREQMFGKSGA